MNAQELKILNSIVSSVQYEAINLLLTGIRKPTEYIFVSDWRNKFQEANIELTNNELILVAIDQELKTQGVESIFDEDGNKLFSYCSTGDEFGLTVMYYWPKEKFIVSSFINIIEAIEEDMLEMFVDE